MLPADKLYSSSLKILSNLRARSEASTSSSFSSGSASASASTPGHPILHQKSPSRLLAPVTRTPLLDFFEEGLTGRTRVLSRLVGLFRRVTGKYGSTTSAESQLADRNQEEARDLMSSILKAKYLRGVTGSIGSGRSGSLQNRKKQAIELAVERLEKAHRLGKNEAALVLGDLYLVSRWSAWTALGIR